MFYHSLDYEMKKQFGKKVYRLALDAGCTCPNRDGKCGFGGCIFCAEDSYAKSVLPVLEQIEAAKEKIKAKTKDNAYIAYFQSHTNTYGDINRIKGMFYEAINYPETVALSIGTRPDCIDDEWILVLKELNDIKPVWVELGLQTINDETAKLLNRGYNLDVFEKAYNKLKAAGISVIVHVIAGLPGENDEDVIKTVEYLTKLPYALDGIKIHNLNILKGTALASLYEKDKSIVKEYSMEEYLLLVVKLIKMLPKETVVHRITGDGPRNLLISPLWITDKKRVQNSFRKLINEQ
ncbi:MAG: TIGR01212 family radical SAM protein [Lachnospiraceae bacterium]|nr:TIGR01212 family radical SAM protein [Lachnospiraceae bacterium]